MSQAENVQLTDNMSNPKTIKKDFQVDDLSRIYSEKNSYNLEANFIKNDSCSFPVEHHRSYVFAIGNVFFIEDYDDVLKFKQKIDKYVSRLSSLQTVNDDKSEINSPGREKSNSLNDIIENTNINDPFDNYDKGYLIFMIAKKIFCKIKVVFSKSDKAIKIQNTHTDLPAVEQSLNLLAESFDQILPERRNIAYKDLITSWKDEDRNETMPITPSEIYKDNFFKPERKNICRSKSADIKNKILENKELYEEENVITSQKEIENKNIETDFNFQDKKVETGYVQSNKEPSVKSIDNWNFSDNRSFFDNRSLFGADEELIIFKISEFEVKLRDYQYEKYDKQIEKINEEIEKIKDTLQNTFCDETPSFHPIANHTFLKNQASQQTSQFAVDTTALKNSNIFAKHKNLADSMMKGIENPGQYWDRVFTLSENVNCEQLIVNNDTLSDMRKKLINLRKQKEILIKEREEAPGPIYSLMIAQMNGFIKRNKRKLNILKDKYLSFFLKNFDRIQTYRQKDSDVKEITEFERN